MGPRVLALSKHFSRDSAPPHQGRSARLSSCFFYAGNEPKHFSSFQVLLNATFSQKTFFFSEPGVIMKNSNVEGAAKCYMELVAESEQADRFGGLPVFRGGVG